MPQGVNGRRSNGRGPETSLVGLAGVDAASGAQVTGTGGTTPPALPHYHRREPSNVWGEISRGYLMNI